MPYKPVSQRKKPSRIVFTIREVDHRHQKNRVKSVTLRGTAQVDGIDIPMNVFANGANFDEMVPYMFKGRTLHLEGVLSQVNLLVCKAVLEDLTPQAQAA